LKYRKQRKETFCFQECVDLAGKY